MWTALIPLKRDDRAKSRLAPILAPDERLALADRLASGVIEALRAAPSIDEIRVLSPLPWDYPGISWERDDGSGLNAELQRIRADLADRSLLIVHGDLPMVGSRDIELLCQAADTFGIALAPDRFGAGTNAIALRGGYFSDFAFGPSSLTRHLENDSTSPCTLWTRGLAFDIDTPTDIDDLRGFAPVLAGQLLSFS